MVKKLEFFFSNRLEVLYQYLKTSLFGSTTTPLMRRLVVVYGPAMKNWLMLRMAQDPDLKVAMGIEFVYLSQAFENLLKLSSPENNDHFPSSLECALAIENELMSIIQNFKLLSPDEQLDWEPLIQYLKLNPHRIGIPTPISRKAEKRVNSLSQHLARLFQDYGRYASQMVKKWESHDLTGWQSRLWHKLFGEKMGWTYPARSLQTAGIPSSPFSLHFFSISFITACEFDFLNRLSEQVAVNYYLLSPCAVFWSDIRSDRESAFLQTYWQKRIGALSANVLQLEELLRDRNPLLANFGRLGREMASQIEESQAQAHAHYILPQQVQALNEDLLIGEDIYFTDTQEPLSLLHALQADLLAMRNPQELPPTDLAEEKNSLQLHIAPNRRREVEILYHNILNLITKDPSLSPDSVIVMAPQIGDYVPHIQSIFGRDESLLDFQILDLGMQTQSEIVQGFLQLLELSESRWDSSRLLQLFEHVSFQRRHQLTSSDYLIIRKWVEQAGIRWGDDEIHREQILKRRHCEKGMVDDAAVGTWDYGLSRLLFGLTTVIDEQIPTSLDVSPSSVEFSQGELLGKWIRLLYSLRDDLSPLQDRTKMTMEDWANYLTCLLENYFQSDFEDHQNLEEYDDLKVQFEILRKSARSFQETCFPFASVKTHLLSLLQQRGMTYRENQLQAIRFCSFTPLRSIPARVIAVLGLQEGSFPRTSPHNSLNLMLGHQDADYCPSSTDYDRYLFLEALHSAQDHLLLSYQAYAQYDGKELQPSLIVEELFSYLDKFYTIREQKISKTCIFSHPFDAFDEGYFAGETGLHSFSQHDFTAAKAHYKSHKSSPHRFLDDFVRIDHPQAGIFNHNTQIELKNLTALARNPIKFHLNRVLEIYLQNEEDRKIKIEEDLFLSSLDKHQLKQFAIKEPFESVFHRADKEGRLPLGLFKTVAERRLKDEIEVIHECLLRYSIDPKQIFQIEFSAGCPQPIQLEEKRWLFPALELDYIDDCKLSIVGKLSNVTPNGLLTLNKGTLIDAWKSWPEFLLYCHAVKLSPQSLRPQLISALTKSPPKKAFFEDPQPYLKQFINYYALCHCNFSPLVPDWIPLILEEDVRGLQNKMRQLFSESYGVYQDPYLRWIFNKRCLPNSETMVEVWKPQAELLLGDLNHFWYRPKGEL